MVRDGKRGRYDSNLCERVESPQSSWPRIRSRYSPLNIAYYTVSVVTFGLPQTLRHICRVWREMEVYDVTRKFWRETDVYDRIRDKENVNLSIIEIVGTGCLIAFQVKAMYEVYSRLF